MPHLLSESVPKKKRAKLLTSGLRTNVGRRDPTSLRTNATTEVTGVPVTRTEEHEEKGRDGAEFVLNIDTPYNIQHCKQTFSLHVGAFSVYT